MKNHIEQNSCGCLECAIGNEQDSGKSWEVLRTLRAGVFSAIGLVMGAGASVEEARAQEVSAQIGALIGLPPSKSCPNPFKSERGDVVFTRGAERDIHGHLISTKDNNLCLQADPLATLGVAYGYNHGGEHAPHNASLSVRFNSNIPHISAGPKVVFGFGGENQIEYMAGVGIYGSPWRWIEIGGNLLGSHKGKLDAELYTAFELISSPEMVFAVGPMVHGEWHREDGETELAIASGGMIDFGYKGFLFSVHAGANVFDGTPKVEASLTYIWGTPTTHGHP